MSPNQKIVARGGWLPVKTFCRFCEIHKSTGDLQQQDRPFLRTNDNFAIPTIGGLVEGWSLLCPGDHIFSLREKYGQPSFSDFVRNVVTRVTTRYVRPVIFEHGSSHAGSLTSCGTDHAHLHIVPLGFSLHGALRDSGRSWTLVRSSDISSLVKSAEYLFYSEDVLSEDPEGLIHVLEQPTSQFFRRLIATILGREAESDYRQHPLIAHAVKTQQFLADTDRV